MSGRAITFMPIDGVVGAWEVIFDLKATCLEG
jgi:hypothetical protein